MRWIIVLILGGFSCLASPKLTEAQALKVAAGNTLIGTANGAILGVSVMGLTNNSDLTPIRFGVGAGTLFGLGVAVYDLAQMDGLGYYVVEGTFNATEYTSLIVLLDTFYGGVTGSVLGMAVSLMANEKIVKGIQYGASAGSIVGFGFGLVDAFHLSKQQSYFPQTTSATPPGLVQISAQNYQIGLLYPMYLNHISLTPNGHASSTQHTTLQIAQIRFQF